MGDIPLLSSQQDLENMADEIAILTYIARQLITRY